MATFLTLFPSREVVLALPGFQIRWYGVLYVIAFIATLYLLPRLQKYRDVSLSREDWLVVVAWGAVGVIVGGRLGYAIFYEPSYFWQHPLQLFALWQGGMSSHGGFVGVGFALWLVSRVYRWDFWRIIDVTVIPAALGLALGRVGNLINQELYVSTAAHMAVIGKDLLIAGACFWYVRRSKTPGTTLAMFLLLYSVLRFVSEYWRIHEWSSFAGLTRGQLLTLPLLLLGGLLWVWRQQLRSGQQQKSEQAVPSKRTINS